MILLLSLCFFTFSQQFCVCFPGTQIESCSINQKCHKFHQDEIMIPKKQNMTATIEGFEPVDITIFGSTSNKPINLDFSKFTGNKVRIFGGEWTQTAKINFLKSNDNFSLTAKDVDILFDTNSLEFNKLKLHRSKVSSNLNKEPAFFDFKLNKSLSNDEFAIKANIIKGDDISLSKNFLNAQIDCSKIIKYKYAPEYKTKYSYKNPKKEIQTNRKSIKEPHTTLDKNVKLLDDQTPQNLNDFVFSFCLSTKNRVEVSLEDEECSGYGVPLDELHYISISSASALDIISQAPENQTINIYVTQSTESNPVSINLKAFNNSGITINFRLADTLYPSFLTIRGQNFNHVINDNLSISFNNIELVRIEPRLMSSFRYISFTQSPFVYLDGTSAVVNSITTDSESLLRFSSKLYVNNTIYLQRSTPVTLNNYIILMQYAMLNISTLSEFPKIYLESFDSLQTLNEIFPDEDLSLYYISFSDEFDDFDMQFYLNSKNVSLVLSDSSLLLTEPVSLTFHNRAISSDTKTYPFFNITTYVPSIGLNVSYGLTSTAEAWPELTIFTYEGISEVNPVVYLIFNDYSAFTNEVSRPITEYPILIFHFVQLHIEDPNSFAPFLNGINKRYQTSDSSEICKYDVPYYSPDRSRCYQIGNYNISTAYLNIQDDIQTILLGEKQVFIYKKSDNSEQKFPDLYEELTLFTTSADFIYFDILKEVTTISTFIIHPDRSSKFSFSSNFSEFVNNTSLNDITIEHGQNDILLTSVNQVPLVILDDPVIGVSYVSTSNSSVTIRNSDLGNFHNTRYGPNIIFDLSSNLNFDQELFLAQNIAFLARNNHFSVNFNYKNQSLSHYSFENVDLIIQSSNNSQTRLLLENSSSNQIEFHATGLSLDRNSKIIPINNTKLSLELDNLNIESAASLPSNSFSAPIKINENFDVSMDNIKQIIFLENGLRLVDSDNVNSADIIQNSSSTRFSIITSQTQPITLSVSGKEVMGNFQIEFRNNCSLMIDKSWNNVVIPDTFRLYSTSSFLNVETELLVLPSINIDANHYRTTHSPKLTNELGFIVFCVITCVFFLAGIILCAVGFKLPKEEEIDVSSDDDLIIQPDAKNQSKALYESTPTSSNPNEVKPKENQKNVKNQSSSSSESIQNKAKSNINDTKVFKNNKQQNIDESSSLEEEKHKHKHHSKNENSHEKNHKPSKDQKNKK